MQRGRRAEALFASDDGQTRRRFLTEARRSARPWKRRTRLGEVTPARGGRVRAEPTRRRALNARQGPCGEADVDLFAIFFDGEAGLSSHKRTGIQGTLHRLSFTTHPGKRRDGLVQARPTRRRFLLEAM